MEAPTQREPLSPPAALPLAEAVGPDVFGPVVMADDPCLAACGCGARAEQANQYYRARYYDPKIGRFLSEDPLGPDRIEHLYSYAENDPISNRDPSGLAAVRCVGCRRGQKVRIRATAKTFCENVSGNPRCQMTLRQMMPMNIVRCVEQQCRGRVPVRCGPPCGPPSTQAGATQGGQCTLLDRPDLEVIIRAPAFSSQSGLAETFGHEFMHLCGLGPDPGGRSNPNPLAAANAEAADMVGKMCAVGSMTMHWRVRPLLGVASAVVILPVVALALVVYGERLWLPFDYAYPGTVQFWPAGALGRLVLYLIIATLQVLTWRASTKRRTSLAMPSMVLGLSAWVFWLVAQPSAIFSIIGGRASLQLMDFIRDVPVLGEVYNAWGFAKYLPLLALAHAGVRSR